MFFNQSTRFSSGTLFYLDRMNRIIQRICFLLFCLLPLGSCMKCPNVEKVEVIRRGKVRRAKLNYLRDRVGKAAKVKELVK